MKVIQKMMRYVLINDLYSEIHQLKQEVYAATKKNGIYIYHDIAMSEKIERMELDYDSKHKKKLEKTGHALYGLEDKHLKQMRPSNKKSLDGRAIELRAELENVGSITQQEQQLKDMEEDMQSFVSTKAEDTKELRQRLGKLKNMYGSGNKALDGIARDLEGNSQSTFSHLNSEVSNHSSALEDVSISSIYILSSDFFVFLS
ncbi:unnamed protein product [Malus baccata var. baccata]